VKCGFASVQDVTTGQLKDEMESFFLSETLKYLYLLFDPTNPFNDEKWIFTTEAHPLPIIPNFGKLKQFYPYNQNRKHMSRKAGESTHAITWAHEQCDASEWRFIKMILSFSPPGGMNWIQDWGLHATDFQPSQLGKYGRLRTERFKG
jgi:mannosidase alpha-like ER degradation enhancer 2